MVAALNDQFLLWAFISTQYGTTYFDSKGQRSNLLWLFLIQNTGSVTVTKDISSTYSVAAETTKDVVSTYTIQSETTKDVSSSYAVNVETTKDVAASYAVSAKKTSDESGKYAVSTTNKIYPVVTTKSVYLDPNVTIDAGTVGVEPFGTDPYLVVDDAVRQPTAPGGNPDDWYSFNTSSYCQVGFNSYTLAVGETCTSAKFWVYSRISISSNTVVLDAYVDGVLKQSNVISVITNNGWVSGTWTGTGGAGLSQADIAGLEAKVSFHGSSSLNANFVDEVYVELTIANGPDVNARYAVIHTNQGGSYVDHLLIPESDDDINNFTGSGTITNTLNNGQSIGLLVSNPPPQTGYALIGVTSFTLKATEVVQSVTLSVHWSASNGTHRQFDIYKAGVLQASSGSQGGGISGTFVLTWNSGALTQSDIDNLQFKISDTSSASGADSFDHATITVTTFFAGSWQAPYSVLLKKSEDLASRYYVSSKSTSDKSGQYCVVSKSNKDLDGTYRIFNGTFTKTLAAPYNISLTNSKNLAGTYNVLSKATKDVASQYCVVSKTTTDKSGTYCVVTKVTKDQAGTYCVVSKVPKDENGQYAVLVKTTKDLSASYVVSVKASKDEAAPYYVQSKFTKDQLSQYCVVSKVTHDVVGSYSVLTKHTQDSTGTYSVAIKTTKDQSGTYAVLVKTTKDVVATYSVSAKTTKDRTGQYSVLSKTTVDRGATYFVNITKSKDSGATYVVKVVSTKDSAGRYAVLAKTTDDISGKYSIIKTSTISTAATYSVGTPATVTDRIAQYVVQGTISKDLLSTYVINQGGGGTTGSRTRMLQYPETTNKFNPRVSTTTLSRGRTPP